MSDLDWAYGPSSIDQSAIILMAEAQRELGAQMQRYFAARDADADASRPHYYFWLGSDG